MCSTRRPEIVPPLCPHNLCMRPKKTANLMLPQMARTVIKASYLSALQLQRTWCKWGRIWGLQGGSTVICKIRGPLTYSQKGPKFWKFPKRDTTWPRPEHGCCANTGFMLEIDCFSLESESQSCGMDSKLQETSTSWLDYACICGLYSDNYCDSYEYYCSCWHTCKAVRF